MNHYVFLCGTTLSITLIAIFMFVLIVSTAYQVTNDANGTLSLDTEELLGSSTQQDCEGDTLENATLELLILKVK